MQFNHLPKINHKINAKEVRLIDQNSNMIGVVPLSEALKASQEVGLDLVEISPQAKPPVCKIMDFGKYKYELKKKAHEVKKKQKTVMLKEIKLRPAISSGDLDIKIKQIKAFLEEGHKVKISITFRGREIVHSSIGREMMSKILASVEELAKIDTPPKFEGNTILTLLSAAKSISL